MKPRTIRNRWQIVITDFKVKSVFRSHATTIPNRQSKQFPVQLCGVEADEFTF